MNTKRFLVATLAAFVFIFGFEWFWHAVLLVDDYEATSSIWRPMDAHVEYMPFMIASQFFQALLLAFIFTRAYEGKGIKEGLRYGLYMGLLFAALNLGAYCYLPIPFALVLSWIGGSIIKCVGVGAILSKIYRR